MSANNQIFEYKTERELQRYVINNFNSLFGFGYKGYEVNCGGRFIDVVGEDEDTVYIIELKRFVATSETIKQVEYYLDHYPTNKKLKGIIIAPSAYSLNVNETHGRNNNISIMLLPNVSCTADKGQFYQQKYYKYDPPINGARLSIQVTPEVADKLEELAKVYGTKKVVIEQAINRLYEEENK